MATEVPRTRGPPLRTWNGGDFYERVPRNSSTKLPPRPRIRLEKEEPLGTRVFSRAPISSSIKSLTRKSPESGDGKIGRSADRSDPFSRGVFRTRRGRPDTGRTRLACDERTGWLFAAILSCCYKVSTSSVPAARASPSSPISRRPSCSPATARGGARALPPPARVTASRPRGQLATTAPPQ